MPRSLPGVRVLRGGVEARGGVEGMDGVEVPSDGAGEGDEVLLDISSRTLSSLAPLKCSRRGRGNILHYFLVNIMIYNIPNRGNGTRKVSLKSIINTQNIKNSQVLQNSTCFGKLCTSVLKIPDISFMNTFTGP